MKNPFKKQPTRNGSVLNDLIGLGTTSSRKSYYPQLQKKIRELEQTKSFLDNVINHMPSVLIGIDEHECINLWNQEAYKITDISAEKAYGQKLINNFPLLNKELNLIRNAIKNNTLQNKNKLSLVISGQPRFVNITIYPLNNGAVIRLDDITEQVQMEEMLIQSEKMMSVGGLAAGMAHELNNPLAGIIQNVQLIKNRMTQDIPVNRKAAQDCGTTMQSISQYMEKRNINKMIDHVNYSGKTAADIILNMLSFSRKSESCMYFHDIPELLNNTIKMMSTGYDINKKYDFKQLEIQREYQSDLSPVKCEGSKIQQVFLNILKNGAQAMSENTTQLDSHSSRENVKHQNKFILRIKKEKEYIRIEIEDNGPGMPDKIRKRIFEPFFTTKTEEKGTGLGLSVSYFIITEDHNGNLIVESKKGKGAKFSILLPLDDKEKQD